MSYVHAKKIADIAQAPDARKAIQKAAGDLSDIEVLFNHVLVGIYFRPEKTAGGIIRPADNVKEDQFQGKCGLVLKKGPMAFVDDDTNQFHGQNVSVGDWIVFRVGDGWSITVNDTPCRLLEDTNVRMKIGNPLTVL